MYVPPAFRDDDLSSIHAAMRAARLANLVTATANGLIATPTFIHKSISGGGPCIDIGVHILDLTLWMMGNPQPVAVSGVAAAPLAHHQGAWASWYDNAIPDTFDVEDFAAAFVRFDNGATLVLEVSWLLHHDTEGEDMQMWLYGDKGGSPRPTRCSNPAMASTS